MAIRPHLLFVLFCLLITQLYSLPQCLVQQSPPTKNCLSQLDLTNILNDSPQLAPYLCLIMVKQEVLQNGQKFCSYSANKYGNKDPTPVYLLIEIYLKTDRYLQAIQLEYVVFWLRPFGHEQKMRDTLTHTKQHIISWLNLNQNFKIKNVQQKMKVIVALLYTEKYQQALKLLNNISFNNENKLAWQFLPIILKLRLMDKTGQFPDALIYLNEILGDAQNESIQSIKWFLYHTQGNLLMHHIRFHEAIQAFTTSIKQLRALQSKRQQLNKKMKIVLPVMFPFSIYNLALCRQKIQQYQISIMYIKSLVESQQFKQSGQQCSECYNALGFAYYITGKQNSKTIQQKQKKFTQAYKYYEIAEKYQTQDVYTATFNIAVLQYEKSKYDIALKKFQEVLKKNPNVLSAKYGLMKSMYRINKYEGIEYAQKLMKTEKCDLFDIAKIFYELDDSQKALDILNKKIKIIKQSEQSYSREEYSHLYTWKGLLQFQLNKYKEARLTLERVVEMKQDNTEAQVWEALGDILHQSLKKKELQKTIYYYKNALQKFESQQNQEKVKHLNSLITTLEKKNTKKQEL